jgi:hypothetical protein
MSDQQRFTIPQRNGKSAMRVQKKNSLLAFFDFTDEVTGLEYKDFKLMQGPKGPFIGSPSAAPYKKGEKTIYPDYVKPAYDPNTESKRNAKGDAYFSELRKVALAEFAKLTGDDDTSVAQARDESRPRSGAGPMTKKNNDLPF